MTNPTFRTISRGRNARNFCNPPTPSDTDTPPCKAINIHPSSASNPHHNRAALRNSHRSFFSCSPLLIQPFPIRHRRNSPSVHRRRRGLAGSSASRLSTGNALRGLAGLRRLSMDRLNRFPGLQWQSSFDKSCRTAKVANPFSIKLKSHSKSAKNPSLSTTPSVQSFTSHLTLPASRMAKGTSLASNTTSRRVRNVESE